MADVIHTVNAGGIDYGIQDATARANATTAMTISAYNETANTASQAYSVIGTPINWKGTLYYTKTAVTKGATWAVGTNLVKANNLGSLMSNIKTYVNDDGDLVFRDLRGADTVLPFKGSTLADNSKWICLLDGVKSGTYTYALPDDWEYIYIGTWHPGYEYDSSSLPVLPVSKLIPTAQHPPAPSGNGPLLLIRNNANFVDEIMVLGAKPTYAEVSINSLTSITIESGSYYTSAWYQ